MHGLLADVAPDTYGNFGVTMLTLFDASVGGVRNADEFGEAAGYTLSAVTCIMVVFLLVSVMLLLNLLIAFLTDAYLAVSEDKEKAAAFAKASAVFELAEQVRQGYLPPPLNLL